MATLTVKKEITKTETKYTKVSKNNVLDLNLKNNTVEVKVLNYTGNVLTVCQTWGTTIDNDAVMCPEALITIMFSIDDSDADVTVITTEGYDYIPRDTIINSLFKNKYMIKDNQLVSVKEVQKIAYKEFDVEVGAEYLDDDTSEIFTVLLNDDKNAVLFNSVSAETLVIKNDYDDVDEFVNNFTLITE